MTLIRSPREKPVQDRAVPRPCILYVEDDDASWEITEHCLRNRFEMIRARTSDETFSRLASEHVDLLLLDIELAGSRYDGIQICTILRGRPSGQSLPIVFVTAYSARYSKEMLRQVGGDEVVTKPVDFTRLLLVSSRLLLGRVLGRETSVEPR